MKWRMVILILLGSVIVAIAQDMSNGLNNKGGGQLLKNNLNNPTTVASGGGGGGSFQNPLPIGMP